MASNRRTDPVGRSEEALRCWVRVRPQSLVGGDAADTDARRRFDVGLIRYLSCLGTEYEFSLTIVSDTQDRASVTLEVSGPGRTIELVADELRQLLTLPGSPLAVADPDVEVLGGTYAGIASTLGSPTWVALPKTFQGNSKVRQLEFDPQPAEDDLSDLFRALLAYPGSVYHVKGVPRSRSSEETYNYLESRMLRVPTSEDLLSHLERSGGLFNVTGQIYCAVNSSVRLRAVVEGLASHIRLEPAIEPSISAGGGDTKTCHGFVLTEASIGSLFRLPIVSQGAYPGFSVVPAQLVRLPADVATSDAGITIGSGIAASGARRLVRLDSNDLNRHLYIPGQTGSGKSTLLRSIANEIAETGGGLLFIDPHGETVEALAGELPPSRVDDITFVDASSVDAPAPINPFAVVDPLQRDTALENVTAMFHDLFDPNEQGIVGPRWESWFRMGMMTLLAARGQHASLLDVPSLFVDKKLLSTLKPFIENEIVREFWDKEMEQTQEYHKSEILGWFSSKFTAFRTNSVLSAVLGTGADVLDASRAMDTNQIILVSLAKGAIGSPVSQLLGYVYLTRFWSAALKRTSTSPFTVIVDEAQTFTKGSLPSMLAEGRKFGLRVVIANQYLAQLPDSLQKSIVGNVGNIISLRLGDDDAEKLASRYEPEFSETALRRMPNFVAAASVLSHGTVVPPFSVLVDYESRVVGARGAASRQAKAIKSRSRREFKSAYAVARRDADTRRRADGSQLDRPTRTAGRAGRKPTPASKESGSSSFLDEWLANRRATDGDAGELADALD